MFFHLSDGFPVADGFGQQRFDFKVFRSVIGIFGIFDFRRISQKHQIGVGKQRKFLFFDYRIKYSFFIEQHQPFSVKIPQIGGKLSRPRQTVVRIKACHKLIIGVGIIHSNIRKAALPCSL